MNIKDMKYFLEVCDKKSISAASESIFVSPQALSKTIQKMEKELEVELLVRSKTGVKETIYGKIFYEGAQKLIDEYYELSSRIKNLSIQNKGILRLVSAYGILRYFSPKFVSTFMKSNPAIQLEYMEFPDKYVEQNVIEEKADIGMVPYTYKDPMLEYIDIFKCEIYFVTNKESKFFYRKEVSVKEITSEPLIIENKEFVIHQIFKDMCAKKQVDANIYFNTSGFSLCYKLCKKGECNTVSMPFIFEDMKNENLRIIPFKEHPKWNVALIYRKNAYLSANLRKFIDHAKNWGD